jgi:predicted nuclease of predicted toxin-antitoxin system
LPPEPVFFIDRNLGANFLPAALRKAGFCIVVHDEHFNRRQDVLDPEVIAECGKNGWILLTGDSDLPRRWVREVKSAAIGIFCQTNNHQGPRLWAPRIVYVKSKMIKAALNWNRPFIAMIPAEHEPSLRKVVLR